MLECIKSRYFIKLLFSFIEENSKLEILKKENFTKKIYIEQKHYKIYSEKYMGYMRKIVK